MWLSKHHHGEPYVILDDVVSGTGLKGSVHAKRGRVVLCEVGVGLHAGQPQVNTPQELPPSSTPIEANTHPASSATPSDRIFTDAEIDQMEEEKQYHGDDPIVRARLGLPSRETKRLISSK